VHNSGSNKDSTNIRNYFFKEGDYIYSVLFYAFNTEGIPAGKQEECERIMRSINIIKVNPKDDEFERKGGMRLILQAGTDEVITQELDQVAQNIARDLKSKKIAFDSSKRGDGFVIKVSGIDSASTKEVEHYLQNVFKQSYDFQSKIAEGRTDFTLALREVQIRAIRETTVRQAMETLRRRMIEMGISNPRVRLSDKNNQGIKDQIIVEFPDVDGPDRVKALLSTTAQLKVCLVHEKYNETFSSIESAVNAMGKIPEGYQLLPYGVADLNSPAQFILVRIDPVITSKDIKTARESRDQNGSPAVTFFLTADGTDRFAKATSEHIGCRLAIVWDGKVTSAPVINSKISSEGIINGKFTQQSAEDLALLLRSSALPASVRILQEIHVPPADR
jgi:preprotein translocase subunit SecD